MLRRPDSVTRPSLQYLRFSRYVRFMKIFRFFLLLSVGCLAIGVWARSPTDAGAKTEASAAQHLNEQRRAELRAALKASQGQAGVGLEAPLDAFDPGRALSEEERIQRRQQLRQQLREIRYESP